jgi:hypothetical protein
VLNVARLAFAAAATVAMTYQFAALNVEPGHAKGTFFSFFTIQSNIVAVAALCLLVLVPRERRTALFDGVRGGAVLYIAITGVVFALLLSGLQEELQTTTRGSTSSCTSLCRSSSWRTGSSTRRGNDEA